jgi:SAM-dependent methyltransferase
VLRRLRHTPWDQVEPVLQRITGLHDRLGVIPWSRVAADGPWVTLSHPRVRVISYPHEWCGEMLHDAALAHARLVAAIAPKGMALKDAHPWNVLFDAAGPRFVDVGSMVPAAALNELDYLRGDAAGRAFEVFRMMFLPYFVVPLIFHGAGLGDRARSVLWRFPLNGSPRYPRPVDYLIGIAPSQLPAAVKGIFAAYAAIGRFAAVAEDLPANLAAFTAALAPPPLGSAYVGYYAQKGEEQDFDRTGEWSAKQRNAVAALDHPDVGTVLDVGCNTGWFSRAIARRGKRVTAVDADGACISALYRAARDAREDIVPLVADALAPAPDRLRSDGGGLLLIAAERRLRSDAVLALGLLHHLVLGAGLPLPQAIARLSALAAKRMVIEFVGLDDALVRTEPDFFPAHARRPVDAAQFSLDAARRHLAELGWRVEVAASHPATRQLLVCSRAA